jgi:nitrogen fixation-related uncharacterized protein
MTATWPRQPPVTEPPSPPPPAGLNAGQGRQRTRQDTPVDTSAGGQRPGIGAQIAARFARRPAGRRAITAILLLIIGGILWWAAAQAVGGSRFDDLEADFERRLVAELDQREAQLRADLATSVSSEVEQARSGIAPTVIAQDPLGALPCPLSANAQVIVGLDAQGLPHAGRAQAIRQQMDPLLAAGVPVTRLRVGAPEGEPARLRVVDGQQEPAWGVPLVACPAGGGE